MTRTEPNRAARGRLAQVPLVQERRELTRECRALLSSRLVAGGLRPLTSDANFVLSWLGVEDRTVAEGLASRGLLIRPGSEFGLPRLRPHHGRARGADGARSRRAAA